MSDHELGVLAEAFVAQLRAGEPPDVEEAARQHPHLADRIRALFPTLVIVERAAEDELPEGVPQQLGDYRILREVGRGGMGVVYEAVQESLGRHVALKVLPRGALADPTVRDRFQREAQAAARLHHTNIVPVFGVGEEEGTPFYAMQYLQGRPLDEVIAELRRLHQGSTASLKLPGGRPDRYFESAARLVADVCDALAHAHAEGVLHRDIKPSNLLLDAKGTVWITDFGLAREQGDDALTRDGDVVGTLAYMAPERFRGQADPRSELYAVGLVLYELLTLRPAYAAPDRNRLLAEVMAAQPPPRPRRVDPTIPADLETIVAKATASEPASRYAGADEMARDLRRFLAGQPIEARRTGPLERARKWARRRPAAAALIAVSALALLTTCGGALWYNAQLRRRSGETAVALRRARAHALANASAAVQRDDPMLALLLAREAGRMELLLPEVVTRLHGAIPGSSERAVLAGHEGPIVDARFSGDGRWLLTRSPDRTVRVWDGFGGLVGVLRGHTGLIKSAVFSPDGAHVLTASEDGSARLWTLDGREVARFVGHEMGVVMASFSPTGRRVVTASWDSQVRVFDLDGGLQHVLQGHAYGAPVARYSPAGDRILTAGFDGTARLWTPDGTPVAVLEGHADQVTCAEYDRSGERIVTRSRDGTVRLWNAAGDPIGVFDDGPHALAPRGDRLAVARQDLVEVLDARGEVLQVLRGHDDDVQTLGFSPNGALLVTAGRDFSARVWNSDGSEVAALRGHADEVWSAAFSPDGERIVTGSRDGTARLWDLRGREDTSFEHGSKLWWGCFAPDGQRVLTAATDGTVRIWRRDGTLDLALEGHTAGVTCAAFSTTDPIVATASEDHTVRLWDASTGRALRTLAHLDEVWGVAFSPDGQHIVTAGGTLMGLKEAAVATLWRLDGTRERTFPRHGDWVLRVAFSPDGQQIATGAEDGTVRVWNLAGDLLREFAVSPGSWITAVAFSPDGERLLTTSTDQVARLWSATGELLTELRGHEHWILWGEFSPDGDQVLTASADRTARVWSLDGREAAILRGHHDAVTCARFSRSGDRILTSSEDGTARLWIADPAELLELAGTRATRALTGEERARYADLLEGE